MQAIRDNPESRNVLALQPAMSVAKHDTSNQIALYSR